MRKNATKIAAMMLSLALTVTSVNVPTTASAANKVKLSATKATLYVGGTSDAKASVKKTKTLKAKFNGKKVKATFTSNKPKVAKVNKTTGKVTAKKAGTATITAKYNGKKATCKVTVKQCVTNIVSSESTVDVKVGDRFNLASMISVVPANASNTELSYKSDDSLIVAVNKDGTIVKGVKEGQAAITIKAKDGSNKTARVVVNVTPADVTETPDPGNTDTPPATEEPGVTAKEAANIKVTLANPISADYSDAVFVGTNAELTVTVTDVDGNPVAGQDVALARKLVYPETSDTYFDHMDEIENLTHAVMTTNAKGQVTFVYGIDKTADTNEAKVNGAYKAVDAMNEHYVSNHKLTVSLVGTTDDGTKNEIKDSTTVKFVAMTTNLGGVTVHTRRKVANTNNDDWALGTNAIGKYTTGAADTNDRNGVSTQYVATQMVSNADDTVDNAVMLDASGSIGLILPKNESTTEDSAADIVETVNKSFDPYHTHGGQQWAKVIDTVKAADLQYATVNFSKLVLSKYSRFIVQAYLVEDAANPTAAGKFTQITLTDPGADVQGEKVSNDFSVQIPLNNAADNKYLYVTAQIISKGQVNLDKNEGFTIANVVGVRARKGSTSLVPVDSQTFDKVSVTWEKATATYTMDTELPAGAIRTALEDMINADGTKKYPTPEYTFEYKLPAFPYTGNAIITVKNSRAEAVAYYAIPTWNDPDGNGFKNVNVLPTSAAKLYSITKQEAENTFVGEVSSDGVVKSTVTGVTHAIGTIEINNPEIKIDASNRKIYSSVHWNPLPNTVVTPPTSKKSRLAGVALVGQYITLRAQLTDVNGNPVTTANIPVKFYHDENNHDEDASNDIQITKGTSIDGVAVTNVDAETNAEGYAEITLVEGTPAQAIGIYAVAETVSGMYYNLVYTLGDKTVDKDYVDLYWFDANIRFEPNANTTDYVETTSASPFVNTETVGLEVQPIVNSKWEYKVTVSGGFDTAFLGALYNGNRTAITINGLTVQTQKSSDSVGDVTDNNTNDGLIDSVTSSKTGLTKLVNTLTSASVPADTAITVTVPGIASGTEVVFAGKGATSLNKSLTLTIDWKTGAPTAQFIIPTSTSANAADPTGVKVYVKVMDEYGNPVEAGRDVELSISNNVGQISTSSKVATNAYGIAEFTVVPNGTAAGTTSALTAKVDGLTGVFAQTLNWIDEARIDAFDVEKVAYDYTAKTITLTYTQDVYTPSVIKELFKVSYDDVEQIVTDVAVDGKKVVISVPALVSVDNEKEFKVEIQTDQPKTVQDGIQYNLVSIYGQRATATRDTYTFKANSTEPDEAP